MKAELGIIGCPGLLEQIIMFIISQYCSLRPDLVISAQIASHGKRVPFNDFFGWNYKYTCWVMYRARFFPPDSHYCSVSLFYLFFFMAPALASSKVASQNFPSENISQNLFSLPHQKICLLFHISLAILHIYSWKEKKSILHFEMFQFWGEHSLEVHPVQRRRNFFTKYLFLISPSHL